MKIVICPGMHEIQMTTAFLAELGDRLPEPIIYSTDRNPPYSPQHLLDFLYKNLPAFGVASTDLFQTPLFWIGFSAGVVGAIGAARQWQRLGGRVAALVAIDGWGVPLYGDFPIYRISHDAFTHWSSAILGSGEDSFYADPPVAHLDLWRSPQTAQGWWVRSAGGDRTATTAAEFLLNWLSYHRE